MATKAVHAGWPDSSLSVAPSTSSDLLKTVDSVRRKLKRLESSSLLIVQDPDIFLTGLRALKRKVAALKTCSASAYDSQAQIEASQLLIRIQRLSRKVLAEHTLCRQSSRLSALEKFSSRSNVLSGLGFQDAASPFISSSTMTRFLEDSLAWQQEQLRRQQPEVPMSESNFQSATSGRYVDPRLPPTPKLVVHEGEIEDQDETDTVQSKEQRMLERKQEEEDFASYERQANFRQRTSASQVANSEKHKSTVYLSTREDEKQGRAGLKSSAPGSPPMLSTERSAQEALSHELLRMASALKMQSISFSSALERDRKLLESADEKLLANLDVMTRTRGRLGEYAHKARGMGWFTLGTVAIVIATWVVMFVIIRLT